MGNRSVQDGCRARKEVWVPAAVSHTDASIRDEVHIWLASVAKLRKALRVRVPVPEGRRIIAQGEAERLQRVAEPWESRRIDPSPGWGGGKTSARSGNRAELLPPFQGWFRVLLVNPGFRCAAPWATLYGPYRAKGLSPCRVESSPCCPARKM